MWDLIAAILSGAGTALQAQAPAREANPSKLWWLGLPIGAICAMGAAASAYVAFLQPADYWQLAKLLLLAVVLACCALASFHSFAAERRGRLDRRRLAFHFCPYCGHDLRANSTSACPECRNELPVLGRTIATSQGKFEAESSR